MAQKKKKISEIQGNTGVMSLDEFNKTYDYEWGAQNPTKIKERQIAKKSAQSQLNYAYKKREQAYQDWNDRQRSKMNIFQKIGDTISDKFSSKEEDKFNAKYNKKSVINNQSINDLKKQVTEEKQQKKMSKLFKNSITDKNGIKYYDTGKKYGDYNYTDYKTKKDWKIYKTSNGQYYYLNSEGSLEPVFTNKSEMTSADLQKKQKKEAKALGYKDWDNKDGKLTLEDRLNLDTAGLSKKNIKKYEEQIATQKEANYKTAMGEKYKKSSSGFSLDLEKNLNSALGSNNKISKEIRSVKNGVPVIYKTDDGIHTTIDENYNIGKLQTELSKEYYKKMNGKANKVEEIEQELNFITSMNPYLSKNPSSIDQTIQNIPNQISGIKEAGGAAIPLTVAGAVGGGVAGGVATGGGGILPGAAKGAKYGLKAAYVLGNTQSAYKLESGAQYKALLEMGVPDDIAKKEAKNVGTINALIESGESLLDLMTVAKGSLLKESLEKDLTKKYGSSVVKSWMQNVGSEGLEELSQESVSVLSERKAAKDSGIKRDNSGDLERILEAGKAGALTSAIAGSVNSLGLTALQNMPIPKTKTKEKIELETNQNVKPVEESAISQIAPIYKEALQNNTTNIENNSNMLYNNVENGVDVSEFRRLQEESRTMPDSEKQLYRSGSQKIDDQLRERISRILSEEIESSRRSSGNAYGLLEVNDGKGNNYNIYSGVDAKTFHDAFEISKNYLQNGELVDLHDTNDYINNKNYLSNDGLSGFSITPEGDLISVFNSSGKKGFLRSISPVIQEEAKTLDCYASPKQDLQSMYSTLFGFKTAAVMDYDMQYDHDNIAQNHESPQVAFMVNTDQEVETKKFNDYDEAKAYQMSFVSGEPTGSFNTQKKVASFEESKSNTPTRVLNPSEIASINKSDASTTPVLPTKNRNTANDGISKFAKNIDEKTNMLSEEQKGKILSNDEVNYYDKVTNKESLDKAFERLNKEGTVETLRWFKDDSKNATAVDVAEGWILLKQYAEEGNTDCMVEVAKKLRDIGSKAGQTIQAFNILERMTPEGMVAYAQSELTEAYNKMIKDKTKEWIDKHRSEFELKPDEVQFIMDTMKEVSEMEDGYEKRVKLAEIQKIMTDKLPSNPGKKVKSWMRISMLFNPKTQVRNVMGNTLIAPINYFGDLFASYADKIIAKKTGVRTTGVANVKAILKGFKKGAYEATNDFKKGINTRDMEGNRFEIGEGKSFSEKNIIGKSLNRVDSLLNYVMDVGDRVFSESSFENSLKNQMVLNKTDKVTQDMIDIARSESLQRTWNDNNEYTKFVLGVRNGLNKIGIKGYGLGDVLIPFAKTPANLTKAIVDFSPAGMVKTLVEGNKLRKSLSNGQFTPQMQHKFVQDLGKAVAGTMLYVAASALAKSGAISGESDEDKDTKNFIKNTLGINSYSIKIGDKSFTYDWAQPIAAPLSIMANVEKSKKNGGAALSEGILNSLDSAGSILLEQSFLQSINDVLTNNKGIVSGIENEILELPSRAIPTFMKQIADFTDGTQRQTFEYNKPLETALNSLKVKIPVVSKTLAPKVDNLGNEVEKYGGENNVFNVFFNPANVNTDKASRSAKEVYRLYKSTGDDTVIPRVAPYYINSKDEKVMLSSKEVAEFQKSSGKIVEQSIQDIMDTPEYKKMNDTEKAEIVKNIVNYSYNKARKDVVGIDMSKTYNNVNKYVNQGGTAGDYYLNKKEIDYSLKYPEKYKTITKITNYSNYKKYSEQITKIRENTKNDKVETINYINSLNLSIPQKAIFIKTYYKSFKKYDKEIINYINGQNITNEEKSEIFKKLGYKVKNGRVYTK